MSAAVSSSHSFSTASTQDKFHGLLEVKPIVKVRQITNQFFQYLRDSVPPHKILLQILMYWVLIVWVLNSFFLNSPVLFIDGTVIKTFMSHVAIIQRFTPTGIDTNLFLYFGIAYNVLFIIIFVLYGVAINSLKKTNKIPMYICKISTFFYNGVSHVFGFTGLNMAGDQIGKFISKNPTRTYSQTEVTATYIVFIFLIVFLLYSFYLNYRYSTAILTFRCVLFNPFFSEINCVFIILLYFLSFISALSSHLDIVGKAVIFGIMLITYISFALLVIFKYDFVNIGTKSALIGVTIGSSINTFVQLALSIIVNQLYEALIATEIIVMVAICLITHLLLIKKKEKLLQNLDLIMNDQSLFDSIVKSERIALSLMANGFQIAHPIIMSNEFQKLAIDKFPKSIKILILWARFCSAFPAEAKTLVYLEDQIKKLRIKGRISTFRMQIRLLIHQREALLSPSFKKNLNKISRLSNTARNRQRRFWESVIQGNISDMETASAASQDSVLLIESEINHLISMYPNNQYIARENSKYLLKIRGDVIGFSFWHQNYT
ncbi:hypothetical protein TRFO_38367 [Tritrichomonas foetus]|uniref:Uncharacterized protein n=1 Tax=Tritrichomonas foetus TaxID=1144522 RepID=A0A1J4J8Q4_9EUKA|nr:hypothetical protein TRFO_38367 [Tritrichomonas foetus]|eukprot:OHS95520.1 hypothetical protein TRFO_38367 [Tritrichomonas foetus]